MIPNRCTLAQALEMSVTEVATLPIDQIVLLVEEVAALKAHAKRADERIFAVLQERFQERANETRKDKGLDTGTVRFQDDEFTVVADLPKLVDWDQDGLAKVEEHLKNMGEPVTDYIKVKRHVLESAFKGWPSSLKKLFEGHRTVSTGKPTYKFEKRDAV
jgi:hypothetical protein